MPARMRAALATAALGAILIAASPVLGVVHPDTPPGFTSWPWLLVLSGIPVLAAGLLVRRGSGAAAAALLLPPALLAPGRLVQDLQIAVDSGQTARPDLLVPTTLAPTSPALGLWVLLAGHVAVIAAGVLAATCLGETAGAKADSADTSAHGPRRQGLLAVVLCLSVPAAVGLVMAPLSSRDPYVLPRSIVDAPPLVLIGGLLLVTAVPLGSALATSARDPEITRGGLFGMAAAVLAVAVPPVVAAVARADFSVGAGPVLALLAALALAAAALVAGRARDVWEPAGAEVALPGLHRLVRTAGVAAVIGGVAAVVGAWQPQLLASPHLELPPLYAARLLVPAGALLAVLGAMCLTGRYATVVRPALAVSCAVLPLAGVAVLDTVFTAVDMAGVRAGPGAWFTGIAVVAAAVSCGCAVVAGRWSGTTWISPKPGGTPWWVVSRSRPHWWARRRSCCRR